MLRVITGKAKGKVLIAPEKGTRPLTDRIKTSIFDLIKDFIPEANVLDLYAGSGAFGIESLSRGSKHATFIDLGSEAIDCITTNLGNTDFLNEADIIQERVNDFIVKTDQLFDLIFLDPPFDDKSVQDLSGISRILKPDGLIVYRTVQNARIDLSKTDLEDAYQKVYGVSKVLFLKKKIA